MLLAYQDREEGRNGSPFAPVVRSSGSRGNQSRTEERKPSTTQQNKEHNRTSRPDGAGVLPMLLDRQSRKG